MKIATNVHRDAFGGITISNLVLFDWLEEGSDTIVGIEFLIGRHILGPVIFRHYSPLFFSHHIINGLDIISKFPWEKASNIRKHWNVLVEATKNVLRDESPDIVLINGSYFVPWILATAAYELGIPIVLRYAGVLQKEVSHRNYLVRRRLLNYERQLVNMANAVIFPSSLCCRVVEKEIINHPIERKIVVPNPAKPAVANYRRRSRRFTIAAIGRWSAIKNFQAFIALHKELLAKKWPHKAVMITSYWDEKFGIPETIERKDPMSHDDLQKFYRSIDLLVVPSHFETFCNVAAEALVNGTSVLVSKDVGFAEILHQVGLDRMVIDSFDDTKAVARAVRRLAKARLTVREIKAVAAALNPRLVQQKILDTLNSVLFFKGNNLKN